MLGRFAPNIAEHGPVDEPLQLARPHRVLKLADRLGLDLPDALTRDLKDPPDLFECVG